jgi:Tfp pilus assembly protein PilO
LSSDFGPGFFVAVFVAIVTTIVGFSATWNTIRSSRREAQLDLQRTQAELKQEFREYVEWKISLIQNKLENIKQELERLEREFKNKKNNNNQ